MNHPTEPHHCTGLHRTVYVLTFENCDWYEPLTEIEGVEVGDSVAKFGVLGVYQTRALAKRVGRDWVSQQLENRIAGNDNPPETREERLDALDDWDTDSEWIDGRWTYGCSNYQSESVAVFVEDCKVLSYVPGGDEDEDEDGD